MVAFGLQVVFICFWVYCYFCSIEWMLWPISSKHCVWEFFGDGDPGVTNWPEWVNNTSVSIAVCWIFCTGLQWLWLKYLNSRIRRWSTYFHPYNVYLAQNWKNKNLKLEPEKGLCVTATSIHPQLWLWFHIKPLITHYHDQMPSSAPLHLYHFRNRHFFCQCHPAFS